MEYKAVALNQFVIRTAEMDRFALAARERGAVRAHQKSAAEQAEGTGAFERLAAPLIDADQAHPGLDLLGHSVRVAGIAERLGQALGLPGQEARMIGEAAHFHDVGKLFLPREILEKPGPLDAEERAMIERHCQIGADVLGRETGAFAKMASDIALWHHQRFNGEGYPGGRAGKDIPLAARITAVADVYDALRSSRPYKPSRGHDDVVDLLIREERNRPGTFDPQVMEAFCDNLPDISVAWDRLALSHLAAQAKHGGL